MSYKFLKMVRPMFVHRVDYFIPSPCTAQ